MTRRILLFGLVTILAFALVGCGTETKTAKSDGAKSEASTDQTTDTSDDSGTDADVPDPAATLTDDEAEVIAAIYMNVAAYENEDIDGVAATTDVSVRDQTVSSAEWTFDTYDLSYELEDVEVTSLTSTEAEVSLKQTTTKISGPDFNDNTVTVVHSLHKVDGEWVIYASEMVDVEYLNQ